MAPEMVEGGQGAASDARADVWSWGVLLHALLTRSTGMAKDEDLWAYLTMMKDGRWWDGTAALWGAEELPEGAFKAVRHSLCERGERVGLLAGAVLLGQDGLVEAMVGEMEAPEEVKKAELRIAMLEFGQVALPQEASSAEASFQAKVLIALAGDHQALGDEAQAITCLQQAARLFPDHTDDTTRARTLNDLALALSRRGDQNEATALLEQALAMEQRLLPGDHPDTATALNNLASCHNRQGEYGRAARLYEEALAMQRRLLPEDHPSIATSLHNLASCYDSQGEYGKAVLLHEEALAMRRRVLPEDHPGIATSLNNLATCRYRQGEYGKAILLHEEALAMQRRLLPEDHPDIATSLSSLATCHESQGEYGKALLLYEEALAMQRRLLPEDHPSIAESMADIGTTLLGMGDYAGAVRYLEQAIAIFSESLPPDNPKLLLYLKARELLRIRDLYRTLWASAAEPCPEADVGAVDWPSKSVVELEAFLRSRGMELGGKGGGQLDRATLVQVAIAIAAEEEEQGGKGAYPDGKHSVTHFSLASRLFSSAKTGLLSESALPAGSPALNLPSRQGEATLPPLMPWLVLWTGRASRWWSWRPSCGPGGWTWGGKGT
jgi:tetratricopeptide (TPR) repeat protein